MTAPVSAPSAADLAVARIHNYMRPVAPVPSPLLVLAQRVLNREYAHALSNSPRTEQQAEAARRIYADAHLYAPECERTEADALLTKTRTERAEASARLAESRKVSWQHAERQRERRDFYVND